MTFKTWKLVFLSCDFSVVTLYIITETSTV